jgi:hypothetical protein
LLSAYTKYALVILNRFNWDSSRGKCVEGIDLTWYDSFQPKQEFRRHTIPLDIFCCYKLSEVDLDTYRKEAVIKTKYAAFY